MDQNSFLSSPGKRWSLCSSLKASKDLRSPRGPSTATAAGFSPVERRHKHASGALPPVLPLANLPWDVRAPHAYHHGWTDLSPLYVVNLAVPQWQGCNRKSPRRWQWIANPKRFDPKISAGVLPRIVSTALWNQAVRFHLGVRDKGPQQSAPRQSP